MKTVCVDLGDRSYDIAIGRGVLPGEAIDATRSRRALVVSDTNVAPPHMARVSEALRSRGLEVATVVLPAGETTKCAACLSDVYDAAFAAYLDRSSVIVALGGGVVGDLAGYAAATFLRGIRFVQIPTSLLAMVDSSVGGKTGINVPQGKNLVGAFHQPVEVCIDLDTLDTLPRREYVSGLAEVVKYGVIWDAAFLAYLEEHASAILDRDAAVLADVVGRSCEIKADVVSRDERESGIRAILNFGHTLAHALESVAGYGCYLHGEAVSVGMAYAAELSLGQGLSGAERDRVLALLRRLELPVSLARAGGGVQDVAWDSIRRAMATDKKTVASVPRFVLAGELGTVVSGCEVDEPRLAAAFEVLVSAGG